MSVGKISSSILPAHSPDLNPCDFFFWDCLKDKIYNSNLQTEELKANICKKIANIPEDQLQRVNRNLICCSKEFLHVEGQHFQHL
jgi:hypothetical protein